MNLKLRMNDALVQTIHVNHSLLLEFVNIICMLMRINIPRERMHPSASCKQKLETVVITGP